MTRVFFLIVVSLFLSQVTIAQITERSILSASGGRFSNEKISLEFTVGDIAIETFSSTASVITQGFIQPDIGLIDNVNLEFSELQWNNYPNPVTSYFYLNFNQSILDNNMKLQIADLNGRIVHLTDLKDQINYIEVNHLQPGIYFISIKNNQHYLYASRIFQKIK